MSLKGRRILITRTRQQASALAAALEAEGAETISIPAIEMAPPSSFETLDTSLSSLVSFDWLLFTSANAVAAFVERCKELSIEAIPQRIAVIGDATARAVREAGFAVDLLPPQFVAESLAEALAPFAKGASMLLVRAEQARDVLPDALTVAGAQLTIAAAYRNVIPSDSVEALRALFAEDARPLDAATFTSSSTATNLFTLLEAADLTLPETVVRASIGPITSRTMSELGYPATVEASEPTVASLAHALSAYFRSLAARA